MHAYLIIGARGEETRQKADETAKKLKAKILEFPLAKIEDTRELNSFTSLKVSQPIAILINSIDEATTEALNAFLKNLEEPQENLFYILTARSINAVLPTIVSRCQVVKTINIKGPKVNNKDIEKFIDMPIREKLSYIDKIKRREEAEEFVENLIITTHNFLHKGEKNYLKISKNLRVETDAFKAIRANGNVVIQLTNMVIGMAK